MVREKTKTIVLYPFTIFPSNLYLDSKKILDCMQRNNVLKNCIEVPARGATNLYSIIADAAVNDVVQGRFVKLKSDNIETIDKNTLEEDLQVIGEDKYIEANAYFVWNFKNNLLLAQWDLESRYKLLGNIVKG